MPFVKGDKNINRNGRPKKFVFNDYITPSEVRALVAKAKLLADKNPKLLIFILEQVFGKAKQSLDANVTGEFSLISILNKLQDERRHETNGEVAEKPDPVH